MSEDPVFPADPEFELESSITFFSEDIDFELSKPELVSSWVKEVISNASCELIALQVIFCSDVYLLKINVEHLDHDYYTDIITFPYQDPPKVEGDLFISIERVRDNAQKLDQSFDRELQRVIIHGVFHLMGQGDKTEVEAQQMRNLEETALAVHPFFT
ncbi:MAG: rRNA maturation RNase YbeY [Bacteroidetes bacterium]|nr:rRNA maturation RNase YbeY [Bacteroidota bacterium]